MRAIFRDRDIGREYGPYHLDYIPKDGSLVRLGKQDLYSVYDTALYIEIEGLLSDPITIIHISKISKR